MEDLYDCHFYGRDELGMSPGIWPVNLPLLDREKWLRNRSKVSFSLKKHFFLSFMRSMELKVYGNE
jgi:hypothetical protein